MTPQVPLEQSTVDRMKAHAEPLVDTFDSVINRALDAIDAAKNGKSPAERVLNPASPPNLSYTTVKSVTFNGNRFAANERYWNSILLAAVREAAKRASPEQLDKLIICNHVIGSKIDNGYKYLVEAGVSIQGQDANSAWKGTYHILQAIKVPVEVEFVWQDNPKAASPGGSGKFIVSFE